MWPFFKPREILPHHPPLPKALGFCPWVSLNLQSAQKWLIHLAFGGYYWMMASLWWNTSCLNSLEYLQMILKGWLFTSDSVVCRHIFHLTWWSISGQRTPCISHLSAPTGPPLYCSCLGPSLPGDTGHEVPALGDTCGHVLIISLIKLHLGHFRVWLEK